MEAATTDCAQALTSKHKRKASMVRANVQDRVVAVKMYCITYKQFSALAIWWTRLLRLPIDFKHEDSTTERSSKLISILNTGTYSTFLTCAGEVAVLCCSTFRLRSELDQFLKAKDQPLYELSDPPWLVRHGPSFTHIRTNMRINHVCDHFCEKRWDFSFCCLVTIWLTVGVWCWVSTQVVLRRGGIYQQLTA